jgi:OmpA-OmpF porin, OOP family
MPPRSLPPALLALALTSALVLPRLAAAADCSPQSRVSTCIDADNLWHRPGSSQLMSVGSTALTAPGQLGFGLMASFQKKPIVLRLPSAEPGGTDASAIDNQANATLLWTFGVIKGLELDVAAPVTLYQDGVGATPLTQQAPSPLVRSTIRDLRLGAAYALVPREGGFATDGLAVTARFDVALPTGDKDVFAGGRTATAAPSLVVDYRFGRVYIGAEAGVRARGGVEIAGTTIGTQAYEALGVSVNVLQDELLSVGAEAFSLQGFDRPHSLSRQNGALIEGDARPILAPTEWLASLRSAPFRGGDFAFHVGGGTSIPLTDSNVTAPAFRLVAGVRYAPQGRDADGDGLADRDDKCPDEPEDRDGFQDDDGCPEPDNDRDGIPDSRDKCRDAPEDVDGFQDDDGCPDPDDDQDGVLDGNDRCRNEPEDKDGFEDADGCPDPDNDQDGIPDAKDICPTGPEDKDGFRDEDGCPDPDNDADGILDGDDRCPNEPEDKDGFQDADGCPEPDNDFDGILDARDKCPNEAETINGIDDEDGCPEPKATDLVSVDKAGRVLLNTPVRFAPGKAVVTPEIEKLLRMAAQKARGVAKLERLVVETYGDGPTPAAKQEDLANRRAEAVRAVLLSAGFTADNITVAVGDIGAKRPPRSSHVDILAIRKRK